MKKSKGTIITGILAALFIAVVFCLCLSSVIRSGVLLFTLAQERLEIERTKRSIISALYSGSELTSSDYPSISLSIEEPSPDEKFTIIRIAKKGFLKVRRSYVVWPKEEWQE